MRAEKGGALALRLQNITSRYGTHTALDGVSLHVRPGDCYGFLGHNGAGKTTALRIALGLIRPDSGRVVVDGFDAAKHPREARARQGGLIERPGFYSWLSGRRNLYLLGRLGGLDRRKTLVECDRLLELVGLSAAAGRKVGGYSQGMRQRLGIAQALLGDPACVLLDEPANGLDPEGIEEFRRMLVHLTREEGRTVILSSHQLHEVSGVCNRIGILRQGRMLVEAATSELLAEGDGRTFLRTDQDDRALALLTGKSVVAAPGPEGGIIFEGGERNAGDVSRLLAAEDLSILELSPRSTSLEEIYLEYSRGEEAVSPEAPAALVLATPGRKLAPRRPIQKAFGSEVRRLLSHPAPAVAISIPGLVAGLSVLGLWSRTEGHLKEVAAGEIFSHSLVTAFEGAAVGIRDALPVAALILAGLASQSLAGEFSRGTLRNLLLRPVGRVGLVLGKCLGVLTATAICYLLLTAVAVTAAGGLFDFTDVVEILETDGADPWVITEAKALWPPFLTMLSSMLLPLAAYTGIGFLAGAVAKRGVTALALAAGSVVFLDVFRVAGRAFSFEGGLLSTYSPSPLGDTSRVAHLLDLIRAPNSPPGGLLEGSLLVPALWLVCAVVLATLLLTRRSVP